MSKLKQANVYLISAIVLLVQGCFESGAGGKDVQVAPPKPISSKFSAGHLTGVIAGVKSGVHVTLNCGGEVTETQTNDLGEYVYAIPKVGNCTITPSSNNHTFIPNSLVASVVAGRSSFNDNNFTAQQAARLNGRVTGAAISGVRVDLYKSGAANVISTITDSDGNFKFPSLMDGSYTLIPFQNGVSFNPTSRTIVIGGQVREVALFSGEAIQPLGIVFPLSGQITSTQSRQVSISLYNKVSGELQNITSSPHGDFVFPSVKSGSYVVIPSMLGASFNPQSFPLVVSNSPPAHLSFDMVSSSIQKSELNR